jgi:hypothetical protein
MAALMGVDLGSGSPPVGDQLENLMLWDPDR